MANYAKTNIGNEGRVELHEVLGLTGAEVSVNKLPAGAGVPFVHAHKNNEEIYGVLEGAGSATIDGEDIELAAGDWLRVSPRRAPSVPRRVRLGHHVRLHPDQAGIPRRLHGRRRHHALIRNQQREGPTKSCIGPSRKSHARYHLYPSLEQQWAYYARYIDFMLRKPASRPHLDRGRATTRSCRARRGARASGDTSASCASAVTAACCC